MTLVSLGTDFYVCDFKGHNVAVFNESGVFQHRIGDEKITCFPNGIDISDAGDILIGDSHGNRFHVACFSREGVLQSEFECPYVKVSVNVINSVLYILAMVFFTRCRAAAASKLLRRAMW